MILIREVPIAEEEKYKSRQFLKEIMLLSRDIQVAIEEIHLLLLRSPNMKEHHRGHSQRSSLPQNLQKITEEDRSLHQCLSNKEKYKDKNPLRVLHSNKILNHRNLAEESLRHLNHNNRQTLLKTNLNLQTEGKVVLRRAMNNNRNNKIRVEVEGKILQIK
jgi:hypothetical protein